MQTDTERSGEAAGSEQHLTEQLGPLDVARGLRAITYLTIVVGLWGVWAAPLGAWFTKFALQLGVPEADLGFWVGLALIPSTIAPVFGPWLERRMPSRKAFFLRFSIPGFALWAGLPLLWLLPGQARLPGLLLTLALVFTIVSLPNPSVSAWIYELTPKDILGRFMARRSTLATLIALPALPITGWYMDMMKARGVPMERAGLSSLMVIAAAFALWSVYYGWRTPEPPRAPERGPSLLIRYLHTFRRRPFARFLRFSAVMVIGESIVGSYFSVYMLQRLHLSYTVIGILPVLQMIVHSGAMPVWGFLQDKYGTAPILRIGVAGTVPLPVLWLLARPGHYFTVYLVFILAGVFWAARGVAGANMLVHTTPRRTRNLYLVVAGAVTGVIGSVSILVGGQIVRWVASHPLPARVLAEQWVDWPTWWMRNRDIAVVIVLASLIRAVALLMVPRGVEEKEEAATYVIQQVVATNPMVALRDIVMVHSPSQARRVAAVRDLGRRRVGLAVQELVQALDDSSSEVRREAARALGEIGDERAVQPLARKLLTPEEGIAHEAAGALARIGHPAAVDVLLQVAEAEEQETSLRVAAVDALKDFSAEQYKDRLLSVLEDEDSIPVVSALGEALGNAREARALPLLFNWWQRVRDPVLRKQLAASMAAIMGERSEFTAFVNPDPVARAALVERALTQVRRFLERRLPLEDAQRQLVGEITLGLVPRLLRSEFVDCLKDVRLLGEIVIPAAQERVAERRAQADSDYLSQLADYCRSANLVLELLWDAHLAGAVTGLGGLMLALCAVRRGMNVLRVLQGRLALPLGSVGLKRALRSPAED